MTHDRTQNKGQSYTKQQSDLAYKARESLERHIKKRTLPRLFKFLLTVVVGVFLLTAWGLHQTNDRDHDNSLSVFRANVDQRIESIENEIRNLSQNDLIINALIDFQARDDYLNVFFQSFRLSSFSEASLVFYDFAGEVIASTRSSQYEAMENKPEWQDMVLKQGKEFLEISPSGLVFVAPVFYSELPEGALLVFLPDNQTTFANTTNGIALDINLQLKDALSGEVLFSNHPDQAKDQTLYPVGKQILDQGLVYESYQPALHAYQDLFTMAAAIGLIFVVVLAGSSFSIRLSARTASQPLKELENNLHAMDSSEKQLEILPEEVSEVANLKHAYNTLFAELDIAAKALSEVENVVNSLNDYLLVVDRQNKLILCNQPLRDLLKELELQSDMTDSNELLNPIPDAVRSSKLFGFEIERSYDQQRDGHPVFVRWKKQVYRDHRGQEAGYLFVGTDTTEAKLILDELEMKNQAIESANTSVVIAAYKTGHPIVYVNAAFTRMTGYTAAEVIGKNCKFLQGPDTDPAVIEKIRDALQRVEPVNTTLLNYRKNGETFYNELTLSPIRNQAGEVTHFLGFQKDVSEAERAKKFLQDAKLKAEESARLKSNFLASMSHEIRTPMNGVLGMLHLLEESPLDKQQSQHLHLAKVSADSLLEIINDILDFSKIEAGKLDLEETEFDLPALLGDLVKSMAHRAKERGNELLIDLSELEYRYVCSDPSRLKQIASNLLANAIKFSVTGLISLFSYVAQEGTQTFLKLAVEDSGIGISPERQQSVFESFTQADNSTTRRYGGTGLGLSICKELCEALQGSITLESEENKGSRFLVQVRLSKRPEASKQMPVPDLKGKQVIVLESSLEACELLRKTLNRTGANLSCFDQAEDALEFIRTQACDLIYMDGNLALSNKDKLCQQLKASAERKTKCILMKDLVSALPPELVKNADVSFSKPATIDDIYGAIYTLTNKLTKDALSSENPTTEKSGLRSEQIQRVLLVEDNPINQLLAKTLLEALHLKVEVADNGMEAIETLKQSEADAGEPPYQAVFMDCHMPKMDGYETTVCIRMGEAGESYKKVPIIAMTANAVKGDREKCLETGMDDYLPKPINVDALSECVHRWLADGDEQSTGKAV